VRPKRSTVISFLVVLVLALAGTVAYVVVKLDVFAPSLSEQVSKVEKSDASWWLGKTFDGKAITLADPSGGDRVDDLGYGSCERFGSKLSPFSSTRCGYPLLLQVRTRQYAISLDELPKQLDGTCAKTTVRGQPVLVGQDGSILYTGNLAIAALGRPEDVGRALAQVHPVKGSASLATPDPDVEALSNCVRLPHPFTPLSARIAGLREDPGVPLAWVGEWYAGGQLTTADHTGKAAVLTYTSCGKGSDLGACLETMSISSEPSDAARLRESLKGATCKTFTAGGAPGVAWRKDLAGETGGGVIVFSGNAAISLANDITLESIPMSRFEAVARLVRPLPPATSLPKPTYDTRRILAACATREPLSS
jgi:hypothetical protein